MRDIHYLHLKQVTVKVIWKERILATKQIWKDRLDRLENKLGCLQCQRIFRTGVLWELAQSLRVCLFKTQFRGRSSPSLLRGRIPQHTTHALTLQVRFWAHIWKTNSPFIFWALHQPPGEPGKAQSSLGVGSSKPRAGQAGPGPCCSLHMAPAGVVCTAWYRNGSSLRVTWIFFSPLDFEMTGEKAKRVGRVEAEKLRNRWCLRPQKRRPDGY